MTDRNKWAYNDDGKLKPELKDKVEMNDGYIVHKHEKTMSTNKKTIGTCSNCGGPVTVPNVWFGVEPPTPRCEKCHATPVRDHGPVIEMNPPPKDPNVRR